MSEQTIIFVEDDPTQAETFRQAVENYCATKRRVAPKITIYASEGAFLEELAQARCPADLYIFDLMLKWKDVGEALTVEKPTDYHADLAGIRCKDAVLQRFPKAKNIIWTMIEIDHIPKERFAGCRLLADKLEIAALFDDLRPRLKHNT